MGTFSGGLNSYKEEEDNNGKEAIDIGKICGELLAEQEVSSQSGLNSININRGDRGKIRYNEYKSL